MASAATLTRRPAPHAGQLRQLMRRALLSNMRGGDALVLPIAFPLVILAINVSALHAVLRLPGFPAKRIADFAVALTFVQGALFAGIACSSRMARDMESGFVRRMALTDASMAAVYAARLASAALLGVLQAACFLAAVLLSGAGIAAGVGGVVAVVGLAILFNLAFAGVGLLLAVRTSSGEAVQSLFPIFFVFVMLSTALMPRELIEVAWFRDLAEANPASYMLDAVRTLFVDGWRAKALEQGALAALLTIALTWILSVRALRGVVCR